MRREFRKWEVRLPDGTGWGLEFPRPVPESEARRLARRFLGRWNLPDRTTVRPLDMNAEVMEEPAPAGRLGAYTGDGED